MTVAFVAVLTGTAAVFGAALAMRGLHHWVWSDPDISIAAAAPPAGHDAAIYRRLESVGP